MISSTSLARKEFLRLSATLVRTITMFRCGNGIADCDGRKVDVGGYALWMQSRGSGTPTIVFESGGGEDSNEWSNIEPVIRDRAKVRTVIYDRAVRRKLQDAIWGQGAFVDFGQSLNFCIRQIRMTLDDHAESPRFIETLRT